MYLKFDATKQNIFISSDTHYNHTNICKSTTNWDLSRDPVVRDYPTLNDMNDALVKSINDLVGPDDVYIHLGDVAFGGIQSIFEFMDRLVCKNVYHCNGNHDHHIARNKNYQGRYTQDLFKKTGDVMHIEVSLANKKKANIFTSHYAHLVWDSSHKGVLHTFGHSHTSINGKEIGRSMDVGVDNAFLIYGEHRPFNLITEVIPLLKSKDIVTIDHHDKHTT